MDVNYYLFIFFFLLLFNIVFPQMIITLKKNNFISVDDVIDDKNVVKWTKQMNKLTTNPIYIYINSPGGSVDSGSLFINNINWNIGQGKTVNCIAKSAYSMAFVIFQNCSNRYVISSSTLMQHQISINKLKGPLHNLMNYLEMISSISKELDENVSNRLGMSLDEYRNKIKNDWWLTGSSAIMNGAADLMVIVGCDQELYDIQNTREDLVFEIDSLGNLELKKVISTNSICPF